jgi:hypothetical protein
MSNLEKVEATKEHINTFETQGDEEALLAIKKHLESVLARIGEQKKMSENKVEKSGGSIEILNERTQKVDAEILEVEKNIEATKGTKGGLDEDEKLNRLMSIPYIDEKFGWETVTSDAILENLKNDSYGERAYQEALAILSREDFTDKKSEVKAESEEDVRKKNEESENRLKVKLLRENIPYIAAMFKETDTPEYILQCLEEDSNQGSEISKLENKDMLIQVKKLLNIS